MKWTQTFKLQDSDNNVHCGLDLVITGKKLLCVDAKLPSGAKSNLNRVEKQSILTLTASIYFCLDRPRRTSLYLSEMNKHSREIENENKLLRTSASNPGMLYRLFFAFIRVNRLQTKF